jgi:ribosomal protein S6--L-glutamate ligase
MILSFHPCFEADDQIVLGDRALNSVDHARIREAEAIILPQGCTEDLFRACTRSQASIFPRYENRFRYPGKTGQSILFRDFSWPHPETARWSSVKEYRETYLEKTGFPHALPFLVKTDKTHEAAGVYLVRDTPSLLEALEHLSVLEASGLSGFVTQAFVPCGGNVLRAVVIGKQILTYWKRPRNPGEVITSIGGGAKIDHHWRPDLQENGRFQVKGLSAKTGINLAAIDWVFPAGVTDPVPLVLEINYFFARRGLGGTEKFYHLLYQAIQDWLADEGLDPKAVSLT